MTLLGVLVLLIIVAAVFGVAGGPALGWGYWGWGPLGTLIIILALLLILGSVRF
jgi:hypothetical protein